MGNFSLDVNGVRAAYLEVIKRDEERRNSKKPLPQNELMQKLSADPEILKDLKTFCMEHPDYSESCLTKNRVIYGLSEEEFKLFHDIQYSDLTDAQVNTLSIDELKERVKHNKKPKIYP